jgi:hypothetical protein
MLAGDFTTLLLPGEFGQEQMGSGGFKVRWQSGEAGQGLAQKLCGLRQGATSPSNLAQGALCPANTNSILRGLRHGQALTCQVMCLVEVAV